MSKSAGRARSGTQAAAGPAATPGRRAAHLAPAYVLHQWDWSETSLILDLFTRDQGRVAAVAKGAKRPYSQLRPVLMPFQRLLVQASRPKTAAADEGADILLLRAAEFVGGGAPLPPARLFAGFYLNELLMKLLARGDPHAALFDAYADALQALAESPDEAPLRAFELQLLRETGVLPELSRVTSTQQPLRPAGSYRLVGEAGLVEAADDDPGALGAATCQGLQAALDRGDAAALRRACQGALPALRTQLRALLHYHLGTAPLRTRQLMLDLRRLLDAAPPPGALPTPAST